MSLEPALHADAQVLRAQAGGVARHHLGAERPVRGEPVAAEERHLALLVQLAAVADAHAEAAALAERVGPVHARPGDQAALAPGAVVGEAEAVVVRREPSPGERGIEAGLALLRQPQACLRERTLRRTER